MYYSAIIVLICIARQTTVRQQISWYSGKAIGDLRANRRPATDWSPIGCPLVVFENLPTAAAATVAVHYGALWFAC